MFALKCRVCARETLIGLDQDPLCPSCLRLGEALDQIVPSVRRFCIHFSARETGWVEDVGEGRFRIVNIPSCTGLNLHDVVTLKKAYRCCDRPVADRVVARQYRRKAVVTYARDDDFKRLRDALEAAGAPCEGWHGPEGRHLGHMGVAYAPELDLDAVLEGTGIPVAWFPVELGRRRSSLYR